MGHGSKANYIYHWSYGAYEVLPTAQNRKQRVGEDDRCKLRSGIATLKHILSGRKVSLTHGCHTWRHNEVLKCLAGLFENKQVEVHLLPVYSAIGMAGRVRVFRHG